MTEEEILIQSVSHPHQPDLSDQPVPSNQVTNQELQQQLTASVVIIQQIHQELEETKIQHREERQRREGLEEQINRGDFRQGGFRQPNFSSYFAASQSAQPTFQSQTEQKGINPDPIKPN